MNNVKTAARVAIASVDEKFGISRLTEVFHPHAFTQRRLERDCAAAGLEVLRHCRMKISAPAELAARDGWKGKLRKSVEDEHPLWLLSRKPQ